MKGLELDKPYQVTTPDGKVRLLIMNTTDGLPSAFALMGTRAEKKVVIRFTGGCKGMTAQDKEDMLAYCAEAFEGSKGLYWSGGSRAVTPEGLIDPMVTDIPGVIAALNSGAIALGTVPRTDILTLQNDSRFVLDEWNVVNASMSGVLIVQNGPDGDIGWDGDLDAYFKLMDQWQTHGGFTALGLVSWNGGDITRNEIIRALKKNWPVFLIEGTGRATDEIISELGDPSSELGSQYSDGSSAIQVHKSNPAGLRQALCDYGFID